MTTLDYGDLFGFGDLSFHRGVPWEEEEKREQLFSSAPASSVADQDEVFDEAESDGYTTEEEDWSNRAFFPNANQQLAHQYVQASRDVPVPVPAQTSPAAASHYNYALDSAPVWSPHGFFYSPLPTLFGECLCAGRWSLLPRRRTTGWAAEARAMLMFRAEVNSNPHLQQHLYSEHGGANMLVASGASQPSPFDHAAPHDAPSDGPLSPVHTAAADADMEGAASASALPATPDAPAATTPAPALSDLSAGEGALPAPDLNADTTAATSLPTLDAPISLAQPMNMGLAIDMPMNMNMNMPMPMDMSGIGMNGMGMAPDLMPVDAMDFEQQNLASDERVNAFARLRFDDGSYYMHTYEIILGRNLELARKDMRRLQEVDALQKKGDIAGANALLHGKKRKGRRGAPSVISEKGGIVTASIASMPLEYQQRRHPSQSASSGSHQNGEAAEGKPAERAPQDVIMQAFPERPDQFEGQIPEDPTDVPLVPIHPQHITAKSGNTGPKGISRRHARIFYNFEEGNFCIEVLGNNGLHHEGVFLPQNAISTLEHGDHVAIGAVNMHFFLPDVALTEKQRQRQESGSRPMSFSFENGRGEMESDEQLSSDSERQSINPRQVYYHNPIDIDLDSGDDDLDDLEDDEEPPPKLKLKVKLRAQEPSPPQRKKKSKKEKLKKKRKYREHLERDDTPDPDDSPIKKPKKIRPPPEEIVRASPTKEHKAIKEAKQAKEVKEKEIEAPKEVKEVKEPKEPKDKGKVSAKAPSKTPVPGESTPDAAAKETPVKSEPIKSVPTDSPPLLRKPHESELEAGGEIEGMITAEMAEQHNLPKTLIGLMVEKRKGPGRPPKDGIMSKRQRSQLIKQAKEIERAKAAGIDPADIPAPSTKPKITKRKDSNAGDLDGDNVLESTEQGDGGIMRGRAKQPQEAKPERTPSPVMRIEDYTEEQLQRPSANYVVLIHEAISSSPTGQMNLQQIYLYIEKKYPWYKFKTTTSGWQSSVRHNLGQHDAFVKGDKEGKGFNWRINPEVSIEKERRKRQVSPPVNHTQRPPYYPPPPNGYPQYPPQHGYPYHHPGMPPPGMPQAPPRLPPSMMASAPRLPPSMARDANVTTPAAPQGAPPPSPYASPWAGGNTAGSPSAAPMPPRPYPQPPHGQPPATTAATGPSGQYGVLYPTSAPPSHNGHATASPYGGPYAAAGASPYGAAPGRPYAPYPPQGYQQPGPSGPPSQGPPHAGPSSQSPAPPQSQSQPQPPAQAASSPAPPSQAPNHAPPANHAPPVVNLTPEVMARYPPSTDRGLITQLEAYRMVYLEKLPGETQKVDNAIRAFVDTSIPHESLTEPERQLLTSITSIKGLAAMRANSNAINQSNTGSSLPVSSTAAAGTAAAIAASGAAGVTPTTLPPAQPQHTPQQVPQQTPQHGHQQPPPQASQPVAPVATPASATAAPATPVAATGEPHKFTPSMTVAPAAPSLPSSHRPSVEPITPVPGSPAIQNGTPLIKRSITDANVKNEDNKAEDEKPVMKTE